MNAGKVAQQSRCSPAGKKFFRCELVSFGEVCRLSRLLARKIKASGYLPDLIIAIGRGGYVPGRLISDFLLFKDLTSMKIEHYMRGADMQTEARIKFPLSADICGKRVLIVDDITDTGQTLRLAVDYLLNLNPAEVRTAVLQHKTCSSFTPDFYGQKIIRWRWIIYPWARYEDLAGFTEKILGDKALGDKALGIFQIIAKFKGGYDLDIGEKEILEILQDMVERKEIERVEGENPGWRVKGKQAAK